MTIRCSWKTTSCHDAACCRGDGCVPGPTWKTRSLAALQMCRVLSPFLFAVLLSHITHLEDLVCLPCPTPSHRIEWPERGVHSLRNGACSRIATFYQARNACWFRFLFSRSSHKQPALPLPLHPPRLFASKRSL
ncbi:hypothetical protein MTO96_042000 [Rhipicephalus appendiculatus]